MNQNWRLRAACTEKDADLFFPDVGDPGWAVHRAKLICARCPVSEACLDFALDNHERFGVWGGLSERERRRLVRRNAA